MQDQATSALHLVELLFGPGSKGCSKLRTLRTDVAMGKAVDPTYQCPDYLR
jgi:hypothetical protein